MGTVSTRDGDYIKKVKGWKSSGLLNSTQLILGAMGCASMCSSPLASCCFSLRIRAASMLTVWESWGEEGTAVKCWDVGEGEAANSRLLSAMELWWPGAGIRQCLWQQTGRQWWQRLEEPSSEVNGYSCERGAPSLSEQREGAEACWIVMLTELLLLPLLPWEGTAAMVRQSCFVALWLIDGKLQVLSLSNWFTCPRMLG